MQWYREDTWHLILTTSENANPRVQIPSQDMLRHIVLECINYSAKGSRGLLQLMCVC